MSSGLPGGFEETRAPSPILAAQPYIMPESSKNIPTLDTQLSGASTYPGWLLSIEGYLDLIDIGTDYQAWDVVTGDYQRPPTAGSGKATPEQAKETKRWKNANTIALLTIRKNCSNDARARIETIATAKEAFDELKSAYETKTTTEYHALLSSLSMIYDDRKQTIQEHILEYETAWNMFASVMSRINLGATQDDGFGQGLRLISRSNKAKAEYLLMSLPPFYANTVENIRAKEYKYDDVVHKLKDYVAARQKSGKKKAGLGDGSAENPIVLRTEEEKSKKKCEYCRAKGWKGLGHAESECFTKKREQRKVQKSKTVADSDSDEEDNGSAYADVVKVKLTMSANKLGEYQYDTATSHHTTNELHRLHDIEEISLAVEAHDGTKSICRKRGTLIFRHNGREMKHVDTLYDPTYSNLISGQRMPDEHCLDIKKKTAELKEGNRIIYKMRKDNRGALWIRPEDKIPVKAPAEKTVSVQQSALSELHERYGHISFNTLKNLPECPKFNIKNKPRCKACEKGKATKPAAKNHQKRAPKIRTSRPLERLHADLVGPIYPVTPGNQFKYLLIVTDDFSRYVTIKPLQKKSDTTKGLIEIIDAFEAACNPREKVKQVTSRVHQVQADWGGEFRNYNLKEKLRKRGIVFKETIPGHSETNAIIERTNRTIMTMNRTAILATNGGIPKGRWDTAAGWSAYTKNRVPYKTLDGKSPLEVLLPEKDIIKARENLRPFGQKVICFDYDVTDKLLARSFEARMVGYTHTHGVYKVIDTSGKQRVVKDPKPVNESDNNSNSDSDEEDSETEITESSKPADKSTTETGPSELAKQTFPKDESTKPVEETTIEPAPIKQKHQ
jgi:transposase InsO family protein